ncbi:MAG: flagellar protein FlgN [Eubacteriales bacterium]|nr:flagellar protein FlgN [Eubacteriales bacterium]
MNRLVILLKEVMESEILAYREMLALSKGKKEALIKNDVSGLDAIVAREQAVLTKIKPLESQREDIAAKIAFESGTSEERKLSLPDIIDMCEGRSREELVRLRAELKEVVSELSVLNALNKTLIDTHLNYSSFFIEVLTGHLNTLNTYTQSGKADGKKTGGYSLIDQSV